MSEQPVQVVDKISVFVSDTSAEYLTEVASLRQIDSSEAADFLIRLGMSRFGALSAYAKKKGLSLPGNGRKRALKELDGEPVPVKKKSRKKKKRKAKKSKTLAERLTAVDSGIPTSQLFDGAASVKPKRGRPKKVKPEVAVVPELLTDGELLAQADPPQSSGVLDGFAADLLNL